MAINFDQVGSFNSVNGEPQILHNPTSIQFGPDGRLYVSEQNGTINAFTVELQNGEYIATANEELVLSNGAEVVKSIQNHNDDGSISNQSDRQVTGLVVTGTSTHPILYVSSSDPRIASFNDTNLDTNSGVVTQLTWNGTEWEAVDIIRGLPRSEENHSVNGMVLSADGTKLYLMVGGNTNNGAPSDFFAYTGEYALSGTVLEIDLEDIASRPILTDALGGQGGTSRQYVYDLPTLDDPTTPNLSDGVGEDAMGMDEDGPWGGNDGFNMAILPADAPMRIFADGLRNQYDIAFRGEQLYTVDNGSNGNLGGNPVDIHGVTTEQPGAGLATNTPHDGGTGDPEPLFLLEDGGNYGHPAPARSNQDLAWTVYNNDGDPDGSLSPNSVASLADLVPDGVDIADGFIIDPSKFTSDPARMAESGIRVKRDSSASHSIVNLGSSSNGLVEYTAHAFEGALQGSLIVTQFNGNVTLLNLDDAGTSLVPLIDPTEGNQVIDDDGIFPLITGLSNPLDVIMGPDGTVWIAEMGASQINVIAPSGGSTPVDLDSDDDGILNVNDPFLRDETNGGSVYVFPDRTLLWDFDANQDHNLPGPSGFGGGLTGVMVNGTTNFEEFFQQPSALPGQVINLDNVKFNTAAGGGTTVVESVSNGDPFQTVNNGEYLFHTGVTVAPMVDTFNIKWSLFNPGTEFTGMYQQIGGYLGTGDQSNYLKLVAIDHSLGEIQLLLENNDTIVSDTFIQADDLFNYLTNQQIFFDLEVDPAAKTATPTISYQTGDDTISTVTGAAVDLSGTNVLEAILGNYTVNGHNTGLAVGLLSSNTGQPEADTFQAVFNDLEISATGDTTDTILYRVNAGGEPIAAIDGNIAWSADTTTNNSPYLADAGSNSSASFPVEPGATVPSTVPGTIYDTERWDSAGGSSMKWAFDVAQEGLYEVRLYMGNGYSGTNDPGERIFDVAVEDNVPNAFDDIDLAQHFGHLTGGVISDTVTVTDGTLDLEFLHGVENPLINGIEIVHLTDDGTPTPPSPIGEGILTITANSDNVQASNFGDNSFQITNTGDKKITQVDIDVTDALYPDTVFDPFGQAGDTVSKALTINTNGATGIVAPSSDAYVGAGGTAGFEALQLVFDENVDGGFEAHETVGFSIDMDPNSIAGAEKSPLDSGSSPHWDVGGVSGAELINSTFTVTFDDGTTATGELQGVGDRAGAQALATQDDQNIPVSLTVNNIDAGGVGTYDETDPSVIINGSAGQTARVVLTKGFIQPVSLDPFLNGTSEQQQYAPVLQSQLEALAASDFPANNAVEFQTVDVLLTGEDLNITELFDFSHVADYDFEGEERLPLGFVASAIDPANNDLPMGSVTQPIYLQYEESNTPLYRVNAGGGEIAAIDGGLTWSADTIANNSPYLADAGSNTTASFSAIESGATVPSTVPGAIYDTERWDSSGGSSMQWAFDVAQEGLYEVRLYMGNGYSGTNDPGERVFDVAVEGSVPTEFDDIDLAQQFGHLTGGVVSDTVTVADGTLDLEFIHGVENPLVNGIEIVQLSDLIV